MVFLGVVIGVHGLGVCGYGSSVNISPLGILLSFPLGESLLFLLVFLL